jgi:hypothetical protein
MSRDREMDNADRLFDQMDRICADEPACDVVYALAMMYAKALKEQTKPEDIRTAAKSFGQAVALEMKYPRSRVNLALSNGECGG